VRSYPPRPLLEDTPHAGHGADVHAVPTLICTTPSRTVTARTLVPVKTLRRYRQTIYNALDHAVSNARAEASNTHIAALVHRSYGFHSPQALTAMIELTRGGLCPNLSGRIT